MDPKLEKLNKLFSLIKEDTLTPKEVEQFLVMVLEVVKKSKAEFESLSKENLATISESVEYIKQLGNTLDTDLSKKSATLLKKIEDKLTLVDKKISAIKSIKVKDGKDGLDGRDGKDADEEFIVKKVLEQIPETEEIDGEDIVEKINKLPLEENKKIDASHIKNLPKQTIYGGTSGVKEIIAGSNMTVDNSNPQYPVVSSTGGGGGSPGGSNKQIQFNDSGSFGGDAGLTYDKSTGTLGVEKIQSEDNLEIGAVGAATIDAETVVIRAVNSYGVSNDGGSHIAYFDTSDLTGDPTFTFPDTNGKLIISVNNVPPDALGNVALNAYSIPYDGVEVDVGEMLNNIYDNKQDKLQDFSATQNTLYKEFFENNASWMFPTEGSSTYNNTFRNRGPITLSGNSATSDGSPAIRFITTTTPGNVALQRGISMYVSSLFTVIKRFEIPTMTNGTRFFTGTSSQFLLSAPTNVEPDTFINCIGVGKLSTSNNLHVIHNDASGTATTFDLGSNFTISNLYQYSVVLKKTLSGFEMWIQRKTKSDGSTIVSYYSATTNFPTTNQSVFHFITNNADSTAVELKDFGSYAPYRVE